MVLVRLRVRVCVRVCVRVRVCVCALVVVVVVEVVGGRVVVVRCVNGEKAVEDWKPVKQNMQSAATRNALIFILAGCILGTFLYV